MKSFSIKFLSLFLVFASSTEGLAISCEGVKIFSVESNAAYIAEAPRESARYHSVGLQNYCAGNFEAGIDYIEKASDMGSIPASYNLGLYYRSDKTGDLSKMIPEVQENYDAAIFYYERTANLIESIKNYPHGVHTDLPNIESKVYMSVRAFLSLNNLYYDGYVRAILDMVSNDVSYTDTINVLENMKNAANRCLKRPPLSVWGTRRDEIVNSKKVKCEAFKLFAEKALNLEPQRIEISNRCEGTLMDCSAHDAILNEVLQAMQEMNDERDSVPAI